MKNFRLILYLSLIFIVCLPLVSCRQKPAARSKGITVITSLFPLYDFTKNIAGEKANVTLLLPPGVESHSFEPRPTDIAKINEADIFIYTGKFMEPWVDDLVKSIENKNLLIVDAGSDAAFIHQSEEFPDEEGHAHDIGATDPHIWLDFSNAQKMASNICEALVKKDPQNKDFYLKNTADYIAKLAELDVQYQTALSNCKQHTVIYGGHFAFGYMAKRYNLKFISAYRGFTPDSEPTPKNLAELIDKIKQLGTRYIYYEELISPKIADTLSQESGAKLLPLNGAHNVSKDTLDKGVGFIDIMKQNLENLKMGLECQ